MNAPASELPPLIRQMMEPSFYPHPVRTPIRLVQTHISFVLLTGHYAYKIKKPVRFPFLDFSTLAQRDHFVALELERNRRFSPELYLKTDVITEENGSFRLGGTGPAVEYVLVMREFPREGLWSERFARGWLNESDVRALGKRTAAIHALAETGPEIAAHGDPEVVAGVAEANFSETEAFVATSELAPRVHQTRSFTHNFFEEHRDLIAARRDDGFVRACHGDLHLNNVCTFDDQIHLFDCIEFNPDFSNIDTIYDAVFMMVDLDYRERRDLANTFLNAYLEASGDYRGALLLPLYASMRAMVRAKVYAFQSQDDRLDSDARAAAWEKAAAFFALAWRYTRRQLPFIWVVSGLSGSGKSTVSAWLAQRTGAIHLRSDALRKHVAGVPLDEKGSSELYTDDRHRLTYDRLAELGVALARGNHTVILDAKFDRYEDRERLRRSVGAAGIPIGFIACRAPHAILRYRLAHRKNDVSDAGPELLERQLAAHEPPRPGEEIMELDTARDWRRQLLENLDRGPLLCA